ncbi:MAG TPA: TolC family protein, partial [Burkholderiales bacterium]|nr:TolC family protein [Burkholderiales bacterium]
MKRLFPLLALFCSACSLAPEYHKPAVDVPEKFGNGFFGRAVPADSLPKGAWWKIYSDERLDALEEALPANQDLKAALYRLEEAQSALAAQRASLFPSLDLSGTSQKFNTSRSRANYFRGIPYRYSDNLLTADVSYEADVFGRLSNEVAFSRKEFEASEADLEALRLTLQAELAADYFSLQASRRQKALQHELVT